MVTALYLNEFGRIKEIEGVVDGENTVFDFDELNFIICLLQDGKRVNHPDIKPLEQYHCSGFGNQYHVDIKDYEIANRILTLNTSLFFFD